VKPFPNICRVTEDEREGMPPITRYAAMVGCPSKYLYLAEPEYQKPDSYRIHKFKDVQVRHVNNTVETFIAQTQLEACSLLVDSFFKPGGTLTVINGYPALSETYLLFWHLVCHFAAIKLSSPIKNREVGFSFLGNFRLEQEQYHFIKLNTLAFGPALDEMNNYHVTTYVETMLRYDDLNKILLTSTPDVTTLLERLRIIPGNVNYFFNLSEKIEPVKKTRRKNVEVI
jgi:hypothetical protein